jgi:hypothetical protein
VAPLPQFIGWIGKNIREGEHEGLRNGVLYFKGTLYIDELAQIKVTPLKVWNLKEVMGLSYYEDKFLVHIAAADARKAAARMPH